jgi:hypothetical protein
MELTDPVGPLEVGEHEDVEKLGAGNGAERRSRRSRGETSISSNVIEESKAFDDSETHAAPPRDLR